MGIQVSKEEEKQLKTLLDYHGTETITLEKFSPFLKGFGPFDQCIKNVCKKIKKTFLLSNLIFIKASRLISAE